MFCELSNRNPLHQVARDLLFFAVVEGGGAPVFVAEKILDIVAVDTLAEEIGCNSYPERVTGVVGGEAGVFEAPLEHAVNVGGGHGPGDLGAGVRVLGRVGFQGFRFPLGGPKQMPAVGFLR